jgi:hypothetical protein
MHDSNGVQLRRLPWDGPEGQAAYAQTDGGVIGRLADRMEDQMLLMAKEDTIRAAELCQEEKVSRAELKIVVGYLARAVSEAVLVADLRGERLSVREDEDGEDLAWVPPQAQPNDLH